MRINWGTGIILAFIGFIGFILFFVVKMSMDDRANHDLVTEEYYKAELGYQKEIDAAFDLTQDDTRKEAVKNLTKLTLKHSGLDLKDFNLSHFVKLSQAVLNVNGLDNDDGE